MTSLLTRSNTRIGAAAHSVLSWYINEIKGVAPRASAWLFEDNRRRLVALPNEGMLRAIHDAAAFPPILAQELAASSLSTALARRGLTCDDVFIELEVESDSFLVRRFSIPAVAKLEKVFEAEIERRTPFRCDEVYYAHRCGLEGREKIEVELVIIRRDIVDKALKAVGLHAVDVAVVRAPSRDNVQGPFIEFAERTRGARVFPRVLGGLLAASFFLVAAGVGATVWRNERFGVLLNAKIATMSQQAMDIRQKAERAEAQRLLLETLHQQREITPFFVDVWEEASRILPDGAHGIKFRMTANEKTNERSVELLGYAKSAAELPLLFAKSELFSEPALTGPITPNEVVKRESFTLSTKVRERPRLQ